MATPHNSANPGDFAKTVLLPGFYGTGSINGHTDYLNTMSDDEHIIISAERSEMLTKPVFGILAHILLCLFDALCSGNPVSSYLFSHQWEHRFGIFSLTTILLRVTFALLGLTVLKRVPWILSGKLEPRMQTITNPYTIISEQTEANSNHPHEAAARQHEVVIGYRRVDKDTGAVEMVTNPPPKAEEITFGETDGLVVIAVDWFPIKEPALKSLTVLHAFVEGESSADAFKAGMNESILSCRAALRNVLAAYQMGRKK